MSTSTRMLMLLAAVSFFVAAVISIELGEPCQDNSQCDDILNSKCNDVGKCDCSGDYKKINNSACGNIINDRCYSNNDCHALNTFCENNMCACRNDFTASDNGTYCFKTAENYGDLCSNAAQCPMSLGDARDCINGYCACKTSYAYDESTKKCKNKIDQIDQNCQLETDVCFLERDGDNQNIECKNGKCTCKNVKKMSKDKMSCNRGGTLLVSTTTIFMVWLAHVLS